MTYNPKNVVCWGAGKCSGCQHYYGNQEHCIYRPESRWGRFLAWLRGACDFKQIF